VKIKEIIKLIEDDGWAFVRQAGSHRQFNIRLRREQLQLPESLVMIWTKELNEAF
jgi:predicted RNA binding protein YcfA (HicA-like mRNA interferase family)